MEERLCTGNYFKLNIISSWELKCPPTGDISSREEKTNNKCFKALLSTGLREVTESFELLGDNKLEKSIFIKVSIDMNKQFAFFPHERVFKKSFSFGQN